MDIAADAVLDIAPATRAPNAVCAPANSGEFAEHLESARQGDAAPSDPKPAQPMASPQPDQAAAAPTPEIVVQVIAAAPPQPQPPRPATHNPTPAPPEAPVEAAAPGAVAQAPTAAAAPAAAPVQAAATAPQAAKDAPSTEKGAEDAPAAALQQQQQSQRDAPIMTRNAPAPAQAAPAIATPTPLVEMAAPSVGAVSIEVVAGAPAAPAQPAALRAPATAPKTEIGVKPARMDAPAPQAAAAAPKAGPQPAKAPEFSALVLSDAPDAAQTPAPQHAAAASHAVAQSVQTASAEHGATRALPAAAQVAREIVRRFEGGTTRFELRLDPPELGRVDVRLDVSRDHRVSAVISADSPQALSELARHARDLEQQLQSAGIDLAENGLAFDLRQGGEGASQQDADSAPLTDTETAIAEAPVAARPIGFERWRGVRVDVMA